MKSKAETEFENPAIRLSGGRATAPSGVRGFVYRSLWLMLASAFILVRGVTVAEVSTNGPSEIVAVEGEVWVQHGTAEWKRADAREPLAVGDRVRTEKSSRATVRFSGLSVFRINQLTTFELLPPPQTDKKPLLNLRSGSVYFFSREKPADVQFRTPTSSGAIRGTEFLLQAAEHGETLLALLDGAVDLRNDAGAISMHGGEQARVHAGQPPAKTALINAAGTIQWCLYYPAVVDADEIAFSPSERRALRDSLDAYRSGNLQQARQLFATAQVTPSEFTRLYEAGLQLSVGQVDQAESLLAGCPENSPAVRALREMIAAVQAKPWPRTSPPTSASEFLADSYQLQSRSKLDEALQAARAAVQKSPDFGFAWVRVAELEFSFGRAEAALRALERGLQLSPRHAQGLAVKGFIHAAQNKIPLALTEFDQASSLDGGLANAWLGMGLCKIHSGRAEDGLLNLQVAATLEPQRSLLRSYLGKAWSNLHDDRHAEKDFDMAKRLDPGDPTSWLYSALHDQQNNRINEAVRDLEKSQALNDNRGVF